MPELPEVESIRQELCTHIIDQRIVQCSFTGSNLLDPKSLPISHLKNQSIHSIERIGKYMLWHFDDYLLLTHLGMSGIFLVNVPTRKHTHFTLLLKNKTRVEYSDPRRFGYFCLHPKNNIPSRWQNLGVDALSKQFNTAHLRLLLNTSNLPIKTFLMDQHKIAGIGNIYANEILFHCKIHPEILAKQIPNEKMSSLVRATKSILKRSLKNSGTTFSDYRLTNGKKGAFQDFLKVFGKQGENCPRCGTEIEKIIQAKRSSYFCPECQKI